jgi:hypothetical protein
MSNETFEISVNIDEHFDVNFSFLAGVYSLILKFSGS